MKKLLVVVDMQNDFIYGSLGTPEAQLIVNKVADKIKKWDGDIICTQDTHDENYLSTREGKYLPIKHCIKGTEGYMIAPAINSALIENANNDYTFTLLPKYTFGSTALPGAISYQHYDYIEIVGLCTEICVVSNVMILKAHFPETDIAVDASCCAGVTPESHNAALETMRMCQIDIIGE